MLLNYNNYEDDYEHSYVMCVQYEGETTLYDKYCILADLDILSHDNDNREADDSNCYLTNGSFRQAGDKKHGIQTKVQYCTESRINEE